jgi:hypothetical protein
MKKLFTFLTCIIPIAAISADFGEWDLDKDGKLEKHEFTIKFVEEYFDALSPNSTTGMVEDDFFTSMYAAIDTDDNEKLSDAEWQMGYDFFVDKYVIYESAKPLDADGNGYITYQEFLDSMHDTRIYMDIDVDRDDKISEYELAEFIFESWDTNNSGVISKAEFNRYEDYYLES